MLTEIIPGEIYRRADGREFMAYIDGGEKMNCIAFKSLNGTPGDGTYRWMKSGVRPSHVSEGWDKNPIAGRAPTSERDLEKGYKTSLSFIECVSKSAFSPVQLDLF